MNIAITIGVGSYSNPKDNLPGSKNDAEAIKKVLEKTGKFEDILYINNGENSAVIKELLTNFISKYKGKIIDEFFFYYSGHGEFSNEEFYYILTDFDSKKRNQTSLQNREIDDLIKTLNPGIVVKVIDACQSGTFYIKEIGVLNKYFSDTRQGFNKCYFLNSSLNSQSSFADDKISFFTASFLDAIKEHKSKEIRYKDIIDVISDDFTGNQDQTPLFVIQADLTEKFCSITTDLKEYIVSLIKGPNYGKDDKEEEEGEENNKVLTLADIIKKDAENYTTKEGALEILNKILRAVTSFKLNETLKELYDVKVDFLHDYDDIIKLSVIQKWLNENEHDFFVSPQYKDAFDEFSGHYQKLIGFDLGIETPFKAIGLEFLSKFPNILNYHSNVVYFISKKMVRFFYFTTHYNELDWENKEINTKTIKWYTNEFSLGLEEKAVSGIKSILKDIQKTIETEIKLKFNSEQKEEEDDLPF